MSASHHQTVLILDFGSQYTQLIARRARECGVFSTVLPGDADLARLRQMNPTAVILSGGPSSVYDPDSPALPDAILKEWMERKVPILGICYGMQLLVHKLGGKVEPAKVREYGKMAIEWEAAVSPASALNQGLPSSHSVWMSHGDEAKQLPAGFRMLAHSTSGSLAAIDWPEQKIFAVQFHPEVTHSERGMDLIRNFLFKVAGFTGDWSMQTFADEAAATIRDKVDPSDHAICALSGGVDSCVAALIASKALGDRLHCIFVDHGLLRLDEQKRVMDLFQQTLHLPVTCVDASQRFFERLKGIEDPEQKRKIIGAEFIAVFDQAAADLTQKLGRTPKFLVQGTLYPDVIESSPAPQAGGATGSKKKLSTTIKSHHNVGGLPQDMRFALLEPLRDLFKDEVRSVGKHLGAPPVFLARHPFPGPGLAVRIIGDITAEKIRILQQADEIFIQEIRQAGLYDAIWQAFAVFLPIRTVGVQGDGRTHDYVIALRAVTSSDGMTAESYAFEMPFLNRVSTRICNEVKGVNRVVYDVTSKPPATIEWE